MTALSIQQRYFPSLRIGYSPTAEWGPRSGVQVHCRQGEWDSACGLHCAAMALTLLGRLNGVADLFKRRNGSGAALWRAGIESYFDGVDSATLRSLIHSAGADLYVQEFKGSHKKLVQRALEALDGGQLVAMNWCSKDGRYDHWVLAVGLEGIQQELGFSAIAVLCLDPSVPEPTLSAYNGRLELAVGRESRPTAYVPYLTAQGRRLMVRLEEIVVIG